MLYQTARLGAGGPPVKSRPARDDTADVTLEQISPRSSRWPRLKIFRQFLAVTVSNGSAAVRATRAKDGDRLLTAFVACRTTLDDLSRRTSALGVAISSSLIALHLTGKSWVSDATHNAVADAINVRLRELSLPPTVPRR